MLKVIDTVIVADEERLKTKNLILMYAILFEIVYTITIFVFGNRVEVSCYVLMWWSFLVSHV